VARRSASRTFFDAWSWTYDNPVAQALIYRPVQDVVVANVRRQQPRRVLDVGCGTGLLTTRLNADLGVSATGCDYSWGMVAQASQRSRVPAWVQADAMMLPLADGAVDAIVCTESFHWYPDQLRALTEFARVLEPGGRVYLALVNPPHPAISQWTHRWSESAGQPLYWPTPAEMRSMATTAGLRVVRQVPLGRIPAGLLLPPVLTVAERPA
jgi:ubiquinone/menaquinone biosynthesis C-methylase UbiE